MLPCNSCPFRPSAPLGLWHPYEYLLVAYLGSARSFADEVFGRRMLCHKYRDKARSNTTDRGTIPSCGGWLRGAADSLNARFALGRFPEADPTEGKAAPTLSAEEVARRNGLDMDRLPPLAYDHEDARYESFDTWRDAVNDLCRRLQVDPEYARSFVVPGSPLDVGVSDAEIRAALGPIACRRSRTATDP